jgi:aryl-alcohol dehydrogenase-like predicted oxidoreductase
MLALGIGTVQFGLNYGISNSTGKPLPDEVTAILSYAQNYSEVFTVIDTARNYGESESILGNLKELTSKQRIITKLPPYTSLGVNYSLESTFQKSVDALRCTHLDGLMTHHAKDFQGPHAREISTFLQQKKIQGLCKKIGISAYSREEIDFVISNFFVPDLIQIPMNLFDHRLLSGSYLEELKRKGIEIHVRSIYLQGLMFTDPKKLDPFFDPIKEHLIHLQQVRNQLNLSVEEIALAFIKSIPQIDVAVIGINRLVEIETIHKVFSMNHNLSSDFFKQFKIENELFLNPANWKLIS